MLRMTRIARLRSKWNSRSEGWSEQVNGSDAFEGVRSAVLAEAAVMPSARAVDLGAGAGFLTLALAPDVADMLAVDVSPMMIQAMAEEAGRRGVENIRYLVEDLANLDLPSNSVDLVVSSYALHHLRDPEKQELAIRMARWLAPGGRLVFADMMFGRGRTTRDRQILRAKTLQLLGKGPLGAWRVVKNLVRFGFRIGNDRPVPPEFWVSALRSAGFSDVRYSSLVAESGLITARV